MEPKPRRTTKKNTDHFHKFIISGLVLALIGIAGLYFYIPYRENWYVDKINQAVIEYTKRHELVIAAKKVVDLSEQEAAIAAYTSFGKLLLAGDQDGFLAYLDLAYPGMTSPKVQNPKDVKSAMNMIKESYGFSKIPHDTLWATSTVWTKINDDRISAMVPYTTSSGITHKTFYFVKTNGVWYFDFLN